MYSDSVLKRATELCFLNDQDTAPPANVKIYSETDSLPSSASQLASLQASNLKPCFPWYVISVSLRPCLAALRWKMVGF